jgi:hypothetical protein
LPRAPPAHELRARVASRIGCAGSPGSARSTALQERSPWRTPLARGAAAVTFAAMTSIRRVATLLSLLALALASACATTRPYQREYLARPEMAADPDPDEAALYQHLLGTREGAVGGGGGGGGGCGCN